MTQLSLHEIFTDDEKAFDFALNTNLLYNNGKCEKCNGKYMVFTDNYKKSNRYLKCEHCGNKKSIFHKSIFTRSKLKICQILHLIYCWAVKMGREQAAHECNASPKAVTNFYETLRQTCVDWNEEVNQTPIGGPNCTVEIDESLMSTRKNHAGRILSQHWIFGGICRETNERFVLSVPDRSSQTLLPIIQDRIAPNTQINSDSWKAYNSINQLPQNYTHATVNHSLNFVDPVTKTHTQRVERMWREVKRVKRRYEGIPHSQVDAHISEYLWRTQEGVTYENAFEKAVKLIADTYYI